MCGLVLVGSSRLVDGEIDLFSNLLFADTFRGRHSTGVFVGNTTQVGGECYSSVGVAKKAVPGPEFLGTMDWLDAAYGYGTIGSVKNFIVGHNRYATQGEINDINAHPFQHGKITMVHNGTLTDQSLLPDHVNFEVDSENICHSLDVWGVDKTIQNLDGAFALIWHNSETETLHIIRNNERPFHLAETYMGTYFGASEEAMLKWILERGKSGLKPKRYFETEVGTEYIFDVSEGRFELKEEVKHDLPDFWSIGGWYGGYGRVYSGYSGYQGNNRNNNNNNNDIAYLNQNKDGVPSTKGNVTDISLSDKTRINGLLIKHDITYRAGSEVSFIPYYKEDYTSEDKRGLCVLHGNTTCTESVSVEVEDFDYEGYTQYKNMQGVIVDAFEHKGPVNYLVVKVEVRSYASTVQDDAPFEMDMSEEDAELEQLFQALNEESDIYQEVKTINGRDFTKEEWDRHHDNWCGCCGDKIDYDDAPTANYSFHSPICKNCDEEGVNIA